MSIKLSAFKTSARLTRLEHDGKCFPGSWLPWLARSQSAQLEAPKDAPGMQEKAFHMPWPYCRTTCRHLILGYRAHTGMSSREADSRMSRRCARRSSWFDWSRNRRKTCRRQRGGPSGPQGNLPGHHCGKHQISASDQQACRSLPGWMNVQSSKVSYKLQSLLDRKGSQVLVPESNNLLLSNKESQLVLALVV